MYTPLGYPLQELTLAVPQQVLNQTSMGYFQLLLAGECVQRYSDRVRIGLSIAVDGQLWGRVYKNTQGKRISEVKVVIDQMTIKENQNEEIRGKRSRGREAEFSP